MIKGSRVQGTGVTLPQAVCVPWIAGLGGLFLEMLWGGIWTENEICACLICLVSGLGLRWALAVSPL